MCGAHPKRWMKLFFSRPSSTKDFLLDFGSALRALLVSNLKCNFPIVASYVLHFYLRNKRVAAKHRFLVDFFRLFFLSRLAWKSGSRSTVSWLWKEHHQAFRLGQKQRAGLCCLSYSSSSSTFSSFFSRCWCPRRVVPWFGSLQSLVSAKADDTYQCIIHLQSYPWNPKTNTESEKGDGEGLNHGLKPMFTFLATCPQHLRLSLTACRPW